MWWLILFPGLGHAYLGRKGKALFFGAVILALYVSGMALGAWPGQILALILRQGAWLAAAGVGLGLTASFVITRFLVNLLVGVSPTDPLTFGGVALLLVAVTLLACLIPARHAAKVDPMVALHYE